MTTVNFSVKTPTGNPVEGAQIDITLPDAGVDFLGEDLILPTSTKGKTDASGQLQVELAPITTIAYQLVIYDPKSNRKVVEEFFVPDLPGIVEISDLVLTPKPSGVSYDSASIAKITNDRILAQQAAQDAIDGNAPRYNVFNLPFVNNGGNQEASLILDYRNGFLIVDEDDGTVIVPEDDLGNPDLNLAIGTAIIFIKGLVHSQVDVTFEGETGSVTIDSLAAGGTKLQYATDVISLVKIDINSWKIFNLSEGALGSVNDDFNTVYAKFGEIDDAIATLEGWRLAFNSQLNVLNDDINNNVTAIANINNSISSLTSIVTGLTQTIEDTVNDALPGLPDLTSFVNSAQNSAFAAAASEANSATSETNAGISEINAGNSAASAALSEANVIVALQNSSIAVPTRAALKALDVILFQSAYLEGFTGSGDGNHNYYIYNAALVATSDDIAIVRPDSVANDTLPGRWVYLQIGTAQLATDTVTTDKIGDSQLFGTATGAKSHLANRTLGSEDFATDSVDSRVLGPDVILQSNIPDREITGQQIALNTIEDKNIEQTIEVRRLLAQTVSTAASVGGWFTFPSVFGDALAEGYQAFTMEISGLSYSGDDSDLSIQFTPNNGASWAGLRKLTSASEFGDRGAGYKRIHAVKIELSDITNEPFGIANKRLRLSFQGVGQYSSSYFNINNLMHISSNNQIFYTGFRIRWDAGGGSIAPLKIFGHRLTSLSL